METGILDVEHAAKKKQLMMKHRIRDNASDLMNVTINANIKGGWKERTEKLEKELNIQPDDYTKSKYSFKRNTDKKVNQMFHNSINDKGENK